MNELNGLEKKKVVQQIFYSISANPHVSQANNIQKCLQERQCTAFLPVFIHDLTSSETSNEKKVNYAHAAKTIQQNDMY